MTKPELMIVGTVRRRAKVVLVRFILIPLDLDDE